MSRRDTIIVAALINAGLLIILFVSALKNPGQNENNVVPSKSNYSVSRDNHPKKEAKAFSGDEVEQILNQFNKQPQQPIVVLPDSLAVEVNEEKGISSTRPMPPPIASRRTSAARRLAAPPLSAPRIEPVLVASTAEPVADSRPTTRSPLASRR